MQKPGGQGSERVGTRRPDKPRGVFTPTGAAPMCDYSLEHLASRPAKVGDKLVSTKFPNSITRGFSAGGDPNGAFCLMPGTELAFEQEVSWVPALGLLPIRKIP